MTDFEPKIVGFLCNWCSYAGADLAGVSRFQYPPNIRIIRVMCSGRIDPFIVLEAFASGLDGVFIGGCHPGDCHYLEGNYQAQRKIKMTHQLVKKVGLESGRLRLEWVAASEGERFSNVVTEFTNQVKELGPSPLAGDNPDPKLLTNLIAAKQAALDFRLRAIVAKEWKIVEIGNVYGEKKEQEEWAEFMNDAIDADDAETIIKAAHGMERAWRKLDALARERGHRPPGETIWLRHHPHHGKCVIYCSDASIADLPQDVPHFHIDEVVKFIPAALFDVKKNFPDSTVAEVRDLNDEIPF